jgi:hypothetical protein
MSCDDVSCPLKRLHSQVKEKIKKQKRVWMVKKKKATMEFELHPLNAHINFITSFKSS